MRLPLEENEPEAVNLTPLIDVVFLLLIFFLVATRFEEEEKEIATQLAEVAQAQPLTRPPAELIVNIDQRGDYVIAGQTYGEEKLLAELRSRARTNPHQKVQIRADERAEFRYPARLMGFCERERLNHYITVVESVE